MKVLAIISEYNPFHNGHALQIEAARARCDFVVAAMSGNFVQRGEPALVDKYRRTRMALACGVDMVIELPVYCASASAEYFAYNAVRLLNATHTVDYLAFGSESGELAQLQRLAHTLAAEDADYKDTLRSALGRGISYPRARAHAVPGIPTDPNDILAVEYLKALERTGSGITPVAILRKCAGYHQPELTGTVSSATAIRRAFLNGETGEIAPAMPAAAYDILYGAFADGDYVRGLDAYSNVFRYILRTSSALGEIMDISEGLHNRFMDMSGRFSELTEIISAVKTKRYTRTRLNRAALHILLDMRRSEAERFNTREPYIRVLGMKKTAGALMNALTANAECPVVTTLRPAAKTLDEYGRELLAKESMTTDVYYLGLENKAPVAGGAEYRKEFIVV